jgi:hypothetical protein
MLSKQVAQKKTKPDPVKPPEPTKPKKRRLGSEVVDPWGE